MERFKNKLAVITGGGSGIGAAIATRLAEEGANVAIVELNADGGAETLDSIKSASGNAEVFACDVGDHGATKKCFAEIEAKFGSVNVLVNNAGIAHVGNLSGTTESDLDRIYRVNVKGVYNCMYASIDGMVNNGGGAILNLASIASKLGILDRFAYSMSKGAVFTMTLSVARDYIDKGIRCNCICPARVHTPFVDNFIAKNYPGEEEAVFEKLSEYQPLGRMGQPAEIASLVAYLCSDEAAFITGAAYDIDGGVTQLR
jgi:NAD(P)-dependent dehydrogenase (short-subunit alcohol dehydrogenase family)